MGISITYEKLKNVTDDAQFIEVTIPIQDIGKFTLRKSGPKPNKMHEKENKKVPAFFADNQSRTQIKLKINLETGNVQNWQTPTAAQLEEWIEEP